MYILPVYSEKIHQDVRATLHMPNKKSPGNKVPKLNFHLKKSYYTLNLEIIRFKLLA